jgi:predicted regulator of Ras-like GTPase activity (Roadblock/LC7/MglB family)
MISVLQQINTVPGVMGSFICDDEGRLTERAFPPLYDTSMLEEAASAIADGALALEGPTGGADLIDFRYLEGRVVVKTMAASYLFLLCAKEVNLQLLSMSLNVAAKRLEKLMSAPKAEPERARQTHALQAAEPAQAASLPVVGRGLGLKVQIMKSTSSTYWDNMLESIAISRASSVQISDHFKTASFKKLKLTNLATKSSKKFPVRVMKDDNEHLFDGKVVMSLAAMESLGVKQGDLLMAELDIGGGFLGWEGR